jgi:hypothetical protein
MLAYREQRKQCEQLMDGGVQQALVARRPPNTGCFVVKKENSVVIWAVIWASDLHFTPRILSPMLAAT